MTRPQERLFTPPRLDRFCPMEHCRVQCGPGTCKCSPCPPWCPFCRERKAVARQHYRPEFIDLPPYQPRLFAGASIPTHRSPA